MEDLLYSIYQQTQCTKGKINIHSKHIINQNVYMKFTYLKKKKTTTTDEFWNCLCAW